MFDLKETVVKLSRVKDVPVWDAEYKPWTQWPIKAMHTSSEAHLLYRIAKDLGQGNYVNVGVGAGGSVAFLAYGLKEGNHQGKIYAVDNCSHWREKHKKEIMPRAVELFEELGLSPYIEMCLGNSVEQAVILGRKYKGLGLEFDFVFIDADHSYMGCLNDFIAWFPYVKPKGYIAFHDYQMFSVREVLRCHVEPYCTLIHQVWNTRFYQKNE